MCIPEDYPEDAAKSLYLSGSEKMFLEFKFKKGNFHIIHSDVWRFPFSYYYFSFKEGCFKHQYSIVGMHAIRGSAYRRYPLTGDTMHMAMFKNGAARASMCLYFRQ